MGGGVFDRNSGNIGKPSSTANVGAKFVVFAEQKNCRMGQQTLYVYMSHKAAP